jgi:anti-sigma regulatory factor (Ser/Thr protein kinase)
MAADASSVSASRRRVVQALRDNGWDEDSIGDAALMTTELVTNAVLHARTPYTLTIDIDALVVRVDVRDANPTLPKVGPMPRADAASGRGLALIARLARRWGCEAVPDGKSVWFEAAQAGT